MSDLPHYLRWFQTSAQKWQLRAYKGGVPVGGPLAHAYSEAVVTATEGLKIGSLRVAREGTVEARPVSSQEFPPSHLAYVAFRSEAAAVDAWPDTHGPGTRIYSTPFEDAGRLLARLHKPNASVDRTKTLVARYELVEVRPLDEADQLLNEGTEDDS